ncbi:MAG: 23S rRNA (guanosine(2251)-2'-O)-methyltransferase RlmB [Chitinivibrionales bacterium]|nr:23S rRNA (guanosine(2251)-2'-O)-methyltransferase RlmB [Chitinivibrionales bacterium]
METNNKLRVIYGIHPVEELLEKRPESIDHVYFDSQKSSSTLFSLMKQCKKMKISYSKAPEQKLQYLSKSKNHQGIVAQCSVKPYLSTDQLYQLLEKKSTPPILFLPASIEDPRNLGSLVRTCVGLGVDAMILERKNTAPLSDTVAKTSAGMLEHLPVAKPRNCEGLIQDLVHKGFSVVGADMHAEKVPSNVDFTKPVVIITGGESKGIPPYLLKLCTEMVRIPMTQQAQSFNVSVAGALLLYECIRQRGGVG